ncbi:MAG: serine hydrolase domain-containing protein [Gemmatimonadota bacterium]
MRALAATFDSLRTAAGIPGMAMVVLRDTTVIAAQGFGYADVEARRPVTVETPFNIASVSKPISGVVALRLVESGLLDLDKPMAGYREFAEFCTDVRAAGGIFFSDYGCNDAGLTMRHVLSMQANGTPGTRFLYNPPSFSWASRPMAEVAGVPFSTLVDSLVFRPAGMRSAVRTHRALPLPEAIASRLALPYGRDSSGRMVRATPPPPQGDGAAGGVTASAMDLAAFDVALTAGRLIGTPRRLQMMSPTISRDGTVLPYGLGWFVSDTRVDNASVPVRMVWHTGLWEGRYSALYLKLPDARLTLILLANSDGLQWPTRLDEANILGSPFARAFVDRMLGEGTQR